MDRLQRYRSLTIACTLLAIIAVFSASCSKLSSQAAKRKDPNETILLRNLDTPGAFELENRGPAIALYSEVVVQRLENGIWQDEVANVTLTDFCVWDPKPGCQTFEHSAKFRPVPWTGLVCGGQCGMTCRANAYLGPGQCRFVVTTCDRKRRFYGPTFTLPDYEHSVLNKKR